MARETGKVLRRLPRRGRLRDLRSCGWFADRGARRCSPTRVVDDERGPAAAAAPARTAWSRAVTPWNAPVVLAVLKLAPALVAGNAVVVKPSPLAPFAVARLLERRGRRPARADWSRSCTATPRPRPRWSATPVCTRSRSPAASAAGRGDRARSAGRALTPTVLELGGNDPAILLDDADLGDDAMDRLVDGDASPPAARSAWRSSGSTCPRSVRTSSSTPTSPPPSGCCGSATRSHAGRHHRPGGDGRVRGPRRRAGRRRPRPRRVGRRARHRRPGHRPGPRPLRAPGARPRRRTTTTRWSPRSSSARPCRCSPTTRSTRPSPAPTPATSASAPRCGPPTRTAPSRSPRRLEAGFTFVNTHNRTGLALHVAVRRGEALRLGPRVRRRGAAGVRADLRGPRSRRVPGRRGGAGRLGVPDRTLGQEPNIIYSLAESARGRDGDRDRERPRGVGSEGAS